MKRFKITIEEIAEETTLTSANWTIIDTVDGNNKYGHPPQIKQTEIIKRTVFIQNTNDLDLGNIIKAINGL